jgi:hypothetical protein
MWWKKEFRSAWSAGARNCRESVKIVATRRRFRIVNPDEEFTLMRVNKCAIVK